MTVVVTPFREAVDAVMEAGGEALKSCYQCGLCTGICPWNLVRDFLVRKVIRRAQLGVVNLEDEDIWLCTTCRDCIKRCPRDVKIIDIMRAIRRISVEWGAMPKTLKTTMTSIGTVGNPWGEDREKRADWAKGLDVKGFTEGAELLYFPCCTPAYDPRARRMAISLVHILNRAGVDFGILGTEESCCGESVRTAGDESLFQSLARNNIATFTEHGVKRILVSSPHCYHTFKNEYPELGGDFEVIHYTQYLAQLIDEGRLKPTKKNHKRVVYHDSCYLGRHNKIYDEPRRVLQSIPGLELIEFPDFREDSLCCGGGGGRIWMETKKGERFSDIMIEQAIEIGANVLAVACPYGILNFDDSLLTMEKEDVLQIKDISELLLEAL